MRRLLSGALLGVLLLTGLSACGNRLSVTGQLSDAEYAALSPAAHVLAAKQDYNRVLAIVAEYAKQPPCTEIVIVGCSDTAIVQHAYDVLKPIDEILDEAEIVVRGGGDAPVDTLELARTALNRLMTWLIAKEVLT